MISDQDLELQSSPSTALHADTSLSPDLTQETQTGNNEHVEMYTQEAQPANTHTGPGELRLAANDDLGSGRGRK